MKAIDRLIRRVTPVAFAIAFATVPAWSLEDVGAKKTASGVIPTGAGAIPAIPNDQRDPVYMGKTLTYWLRIIQNRDAENMETAFDAIVELGPDASRAVPELTRIVAEPFTPIQPGVDSRSVIGAKLRGIELRADAIDGLAAIGEAAAPSAAAVIEWGLAVRVIPPPESNLRDNELFIDLVIVDVLERMRVAGAVAQFGVDAAGPVEDLVRSPDGERRKLAVAILNEGALPIASDLLKSKNCRSRTLGVSILFDMWPVVARDHLLNLNKMLGCEEKQTTPRSAR